MKLSKMTGLIIAIGIFVIAGIYLYMDYSQMVDEKAHMKEQLTLSQIQLQRIQLDLLSTQQMELEGQLRQVTSEFEAAKTKLSLPISSIDAATTLYEVAQTWGLLVNELTSSGLTDESLEETALSVISMTAEVEGDMPNLVNFITHLNDFYTTGVVRSVTITAPGVGSGDNVSASVRLAIYTYRGD